MKDRGYPSICDFGSDLSALLLLFVIMIVCTCYVYRNLLRRKEPMEERVL